MPSGFVVTGKGDLDSLLKAYVSGTKAAATGLKVGSQDLADRYSYTNYAGYDRLGYSTNFKSKSPATDAGGNGDLKFLFQYSGYA